MARNRLTDLVSGSVSNEGDVIKELTWVLRNLILLIRRILDPEFETNARSIHLF